ncbi:MAG: 2-hydroxychromene-2-carboxylate isomerase [Betaproteobacteria bacterium]|nr:2-hydroxychromene-2-carboxylate isomerase [Betaproteobacteria bacterium]MBA3777210.1 2-hydroxychromene-2-carboxylate isomerase [Betaproteobacteria bacterium]
MANVVDYYFTPVSPFMYLGHDRFVDLAAKHGASIAVKPINLGEVFQVSGGLPLPKRSPQRQAYRLVELQRWAQFLGKPMNAQPKFFPVGGDLAAGFVLAAVEQGPPQALALTGAIGRAIWEQERNVADLDTLTTIATECGCDFVSLAARAQTPEITGRYAALTEEAIARGVFAAPTYIYRDEMFWGQDRLDFLARALAQ